ncbi:hypothetical protein Xoosp14_26 [Xanthomonas phage Xoo-sp14]|nr:hypothetical protein Xoosp14_26 [Xanthomonas phage Xoo-sp14]
MNAVYPYLVWCLAIVIVIMLLALVYLGRQIRLVYVARKQYEASASKAAAMATHMEKEYNALAQDCHILYFALANAWSSFRVMKDGQWHVYISLPTGLVVYVLPEDQVELFSVIAEGKDPEEVITPVQVRERLLGTAI